MNVDSRMVEAGTDDYTPVSLPSCFLSDLGETCEVNADSFNGGAGTDRCDRDRDPLAPCSSLGFDRGKTLMCTRTAS